MSPPIDSFFLRVGARHALALLGVAVALVLLVGPAFVHAAELWSEFDEFSYGFLVVPVTVMLIWLRRDVIRRSLGRGGRRSLPLLIGTVVGYVVLQRIGISALVGLAVIPVLLSVVVYLWGWAAGRELAFPIGFLSFGLVVYRGLLGWLGFALQEVTAVGAGTLAHVIGVPVVRDGLVLRSDQFAFIVAEACSGMSSLLSLLALAAVWGYVARGPSSGRLAIMLSVLPVVVVANTARVTVVLLVAGWFGEGAAMGFFHGASSLVLFGLALAGLLIVSWIAGCRTPRLATLS